MILGQAWSKMGATGLELTLKSCTAKKKKQAKHRNFQLFAIVSQFKELITIEVLQSLRLTLKYWENIQSNQILQATIEKIKFNLFKKTNNIIILQNITSNFV